jgi:hypothetical protein
MATVAPDRTVQADFSAGMYRSVARERIPSNGVYDILNGLLDEDGAIYRRGGSSYRSTQDFGPLTFLWDGWLSAGQRTVIGKSSAFAIVNTNGTVTSIAGTGMAKPGRPAVLNGVLYLPGGSTYDGTTVGTAAKVSSLYTVVANRLVSAAGDRIDFSVAATPGTFNATDFHRVPGGVQVLGLAGLRDMCAVFTTGGVWLIRNMAFDLVDAQGNVQQTLDEYSPDVVLWGNAGIVGWEEALVVPALDGVYLMSLGVASEAGVPFARISDAINDLYLEHVRLGRWPGLATVYRNHYILPILDATGTVDMLVCNLAAVPDSRGRRPYPWSRMDGFGAKLAAVAVRQDTLPRLLGAAAQRVLNLSYFDPGVTAALDADGSVPGAWEVTTRDIATGPLNANTIMKIRGTYELAKSDASQATLSAFVLVGRPVSGAAEWGLFDWGGAEWTPAETALTLEGSAPEDVFAKHPFSWPVRKRARYGRFRLRCDDASVKLTLRALEVFVRGSGRI